MEMPSIHDFKNYLLGSTNGNAANRQDESRQGGRIEKLQVCWMLDDSKRGGAPFSGYEL